MYGTPTNCSSSVVGDCCASAVTENVFRFDSRRLKLTPPCWSKLLRSLDRWYIRNAPSYRAANSLWLPWYVTSPFGFTIVMKSEIVRSPGPRSRTLSSYVRDTISDGVVLQP